MNDQDNPVRLGEVIRELAEAMFGEDPLNLLLHEEQKRLGWGATYAIFGGLDMPDPEHRFIIYGAVPTQQGLITTLREAQMDPERRTALVAKYQELLDGHTLPGKVSSIHQPEGRPGKVHASIVWPIPRATYLLARDAGWDWDRFEAGTKAHLGIACAAYRTHRIATGGAL